MKFMCKRQNTPTIIISLLQVLLSIGLMYVAIDKQSFMLSLLALFMCSVNIEVS